jgi:hypothetical protein
MTDAGVARICRSGGGTVRGIRLYGVAGRIVSGRRPAAPSGWFRRRAAELPLVREPGRFVNRHGPSAADGHHPHLPDAAVGLGDDSLSQHTPAGHPVRAPRSGATHRPLDGGDPPFGHPSPPGRPLDGSCRRVVVAQRGQGGQQEAGKGQDRREHDAFGSRPCPGQLQVPPPNASGCEAAGHAEQEQCPAKQQFDPQDQEGVVGELRPAQRYPAACATERNTTSATSASSTVNARLSPNTRKVAAATGRFTAHRTTSNRP